MRPETLEQEIADTYGVQEKRQPFGIEECEDVFAQIVLRGVCKEDALRKEGAIGDGIEE